jgi:hypothetical protein
MNFAPSLHRKRPRRARCQWCGKSFNVPSRGRLPRFCSPAHRQRAYERRKWGQPTLVALAKDFAEIEDDARIRAAVARALREVGILPPPPPLVRHQKVKASLRVIVGGKPNDEG